MTEYIEREAINELVKKLKPNFAPQHRHTLDAFVYAIIDKIPAADVAPVVHGEWIEHGNWWGHIEYECSACQGQTFDASEFAYCPHCGAKMDGGR